MNEYHSSKICVSSESNATGLKSNCRPNQRGGHRAIHLFRTSAGSPVHQVLTYKKQEWVLVTEKSRGLPRSCINIPFIDIDDAVLETALSVLAALENQEARTSICKCNGWVKKKFARLHKDKLISDADFAKMVKFLNETS